MPVAIHPMLAISIEKPFDNPEYLFEIKWDGYRAVSFIKDGSVRLVSRNQNDLTGQYPDLPQLSHFGKAETALCDGEVVALDEQGRASFRLMQQRTGIREHGRRVGGRGDIPVLYYVFDLIYVDGYDLRRVSLEERKQVLAEILTSTGPVRYSDHFDQGTKLFEAAKQQGIEGIVAKRRGSCYEERRSREWLKIKITQTVDCVIGGYTDPEGSRQYFGSIVLGLYDKKGNLIHVGQAGTGFNQATLKQIFSLLRDRETNRNPFHGNVDARRVHWIKPELVAERKITERTHENGDCGLQLRGLVFMGPWDDKYLKECTIADHTICMITN